MGSPLCPRETSLEFTYTSSTRLNTFTHPDDLVRIQKKKKQGPKGVIRRWFSSALWSKVGHQILVNGYHASRARLSRTLSPPYTFGSMSVRWDTIFYLKLWAEHSTPSYNNSPNLIWGPTAANLEPRPRGKSSQRQLVLLLLRCADCHGKCHATLTRPTRGKVAYSTLPG